MRCAQQYYDVDRSVAGRQAAAAENEAVNKLKIKCVCVCVRESKAKQSK